MKRRSVSITAQVMEYAQITENANVRLDSSEKTANCKDVKLIVITMEIAIYSKESVIVMMIILGRCAKIKNAIIIALDMGNAICSGNVCVIMNSWGKIAREECVKMGVMVII